MLTAILILAAANCTAIPDPDQRAYCRAMQDNRPEACVAIANYDLRQRCQAELSGAGGNCGFISDPGQRELCRAQRG